MTDVFCLASNDGDFSTLAECTRRSGHDGHHCDTRKQLAWDEFGEIEQCPAYFDHGEPANRAQRRGTTTHPRRAEKRIRRGGRNGR